MESFTAMSPEGIAAVKEAQSHRTPYSISVWGCRAQDFQTMRTALMDYQDVGDSDAACIAEDLIDELHATELLVLHGESFAVFVDALVSRWENHSDDAAGSLLSCIAETLGIEFI